ncbi:MAG: DUF692 domain-containing protein [Acidobacteriaceae bacterium]
MPANRFNAFTNYRVGIGLRIQHYDHILSRNPTVDWFEIISENYMVDGGRPLKKLDDILDQYRVVQHGVSMYFGSAQPLNREHLRRLKELTRRTKTPWLSDHLCWGSVDGTYTHDLLPLPYIFEAIRTTAARIREVQDYLEIPVAVENVSSYAEFYESQMTEWEFLNEVVHAADCGILLDVNNIYASSQNHGFDPMRYVNAVDAERVAQIHIAGHSKFEKYILDTHDHPVLDPVWKLYARAIERTGPTATLTRPSWTSPVTFRSRCSSTTATFAWKRSATRSKRSFGNRMVQENQASRLPAWKSPPKSPHRARKTASRVNRVVPTRSRKRIGLQPNPQIPITQECL